MSPSDWAVFSSPGISCKDEIDPGSIVGRSSTSLLVPHCVSLLPGSILFIAVIDSEHTIMLSGYLLMYR